MPKFAFTVCFIISPFSFIACFIWPFLHAETIPHVAFPFTLIYCSTLEVKLIPFLTNFMVIVRSTPNLNIRYTLPNCFLILHLREVAIRNWFFSFFTFNNISLRILLLLCKFHLLFFLKLLLWYRFILSLHIIMINFCLLLCFLA